jgi:hypothetical protein
MGCPETYAQCSLRVKATLNQKGQRVGEKPRRGNDLQSVDVPCVEDPRAISAGSQSNP